MTEIDAPAVPAPPAEVILNGDGEVMVLAAWSGPEALDWDVPEEGLIRARLSDGAETAFTVPAEATRAAVANGRLLLVRPGQDGRPQAERWLYGG